MTSAFSWQNSVSLCPLHSVLQGRICLLLQVPLDCLLLHSSPLWWKGREGNGTPLQYFAWKIPWMEEPGRLQSMGLLRVGHDWATSLFTFHFHALEKEMATHSSVLAWRIPGMAEPGGCRLWGHTVRHDWSDLAAAAAWWKGDLFWVLILEGLVGLHWTVQLLQH